MNSESLMNFGVVDLRNSVEFSMFISFAGEVMNFIVACKLSSYISKMLRPDLNGTPFLPPEKRGQKRVGVEGGKDAQMISILKNTFSLTDDFWLARRQIYDGGGGVVSVSGVYDEVYEFIIFLGNQLRIGRIFQDFVVRMDGC